MNQKLNKNRLKSKSQEINLHNDIELGLNTSENITEKKEILT